MTDEGRSTQEEPGMYEPGREPDPGALAPRKAAAARRAAPTRDASPARGADRGDPPAPVPKIPGGVRQNLGRTAEARERRRLLLAVVAGPVTQAELAAALGVTQATVSRDADALGLARVRGRYVVLP